jgi:hypothetical protein
MGIDLTCETGLSLTQAARHIPPTRKGRPTNPSTIFRCITRGALAPSGARVRLEAVRRPSGWLTSVEAIARFFARLTPDRGDDPAPLPRSPGKRQRARRNLSAPVRKLLSRRHFLAIARKPLQPDRDAVEYRNSWGFLGFLAGPRFRLRSRRLQVRILSGIVTFSGKQPNHG